MNKYYQKRIKSDNYSDGACMFRVGDSSKSGNQPFGLERRRESWDQRLFCRSAPSLPVKEDPFWETVTSLSGLYESSAAP
jgi:hypothetical protein